MNRLTRPVALDGPPDAGSQAGLRQVHRAVAELRRGAVVRLLGPTGVMLLLAAETAGAVGLAELRAQAAAPETLLLARLRAAAVLESPVAPLLPGAETALVALAVPEGLLDIPLLRGLADPTEIQADPANLRMVLPERPLPAGAEAAVALAKLARLLPAMVVAPMDGSRAAADMLSVEEAAIRAYPHALTVGLRRVAEAAVPLESAPDARVIAFRPDDGGIEHLAIVVGAPDAAAAPLVRVHSACLTGDLLGSLRCDCGPQLRAALARMAAEGAGVLLYLAQEGRGIGLVNKLRAYAIQDRGQDTVDANLSLGWAVDERSFLAAAIMLEQLGIARVRLLTNNPAKISALEACGITVAAREPHVMAPNGINDSYLRAKSDRLGHLPQ